MGSFLHKYNTDNVHTRAVIVGLVNLLNSKIFYENVLSDTNIESVTVPFLPNMGGDERFMQDFFTHWNDCLHPRMADGNYDVIPRGTVILDGNTINTNMMTHRFVRGNYVKEVAGELQRFNAFLNSIPLTLDFTIEVETDKLLDAFKIQQSILETFYKVQVFSVNFKGFRVPCQAGFSDDLGVEKTFEFSYQSEDKIKFKFSISLETYYPVTDRTTERRDSNRMNAIGGKIYPEDEKTNSSHYIEILTPKSNDTFFSGGTLPISWEYRGIISQVNLFYQIEGTSQWIPIAKNIKNKGFYDWDIPFFNAEGKEADDDPISTKVITSTGIEGNVRAIINSGGSVDRIIIFKEGLGYAENDEVEISTVPKPFTLPTPTVSPVVQLEIENSGSIKGFNIINPGSGFSPSIETKILIKVEDNTNSSIYGILQKEGKFTGDINNTTIAPDTYYIQNVVPTVFELLEEGYLKEGLQVFGYGIPDDTYINEIDQVNNRIKLTLPVTTTSLEQKFTLSPVEAVLKIF